MDATIAAAITALNSFGAWLTTRVDIATVVIIVLMFGSYRVLAHAQRRKDVDLINILRNADGKFSFLNAAGLGSFIISSWVLMHDTLAGTLTDVQWIGYLLFWSGVPIANELAKKWDGRLPWSKQ